MSSHFDNIGLYNVYNYEHVHYTLYIEIRSIPKAHQRFRTGVVFNLPDVHIVPHA